MCTGPTSTALPERMQTPSDRNLLQVLSTVSHLCRVEVRLGTQAGFSE